MINPMPIQLPVLFVLTFVFSLPQLNAQQSANFDDGFRAGATINYGGIYYEGNGGSLNDIWSNSYGYEAHVLYGYNLSSWVSVESGINFLVNRYRFDDQRTPVTSNQGEPSGSFIKTSMEGAVGTTNLGLPVNFIIRPIKNKAFYAVVGPEISYKIAHSNGTIITVYETKSDEDNMILFQIAYDIPEQSNNTLLSVNAGVGYSFDSSSLPLNIEFRAKQSITPYVGGDDFITSWIRNLSLTISYRL